MARQYKKSYKFYTAWNYRRELEDLNKASEKGWQLIHGGSFSSRFKWNPDVRYRYQLDYPGEIEDMGRYIETFREQGWEYINSTFNGWHYFRKFYDPSLPEEAYEIFTDRSSLKEMNHRWVKLAGALLTALGLIMAANWIYYFLRPKLPTLILALALLPLFALVARGVYIMRTPEKRKNRHWDSVLFAVMIAATVGGCVGAGLLLVNRPYFNSTFAGDEINPIPASENQAVQWCAFDVDYRDRYYIDLEITADSPVCLSIKNESGETVYTAEGSSVTEKGRTLSLEAGTYTVAFSDFAGGALEITLEID